MWAAGFPSPKIAKYVRTCCDVSDCWHCQSCHAPLYVNCTAQHAIWLHSGPCGPRPALGQGKGGEGRWGECAAAENYHWNTNSKIRSSWCSEEAKCDRLCFLFPSEGPCLKHKHARWWALSSAEGKGGGGRRLWTRYAGSYVLNERKWGEDLQLIALPLMGLSESMLLRFRPRRPIVGSRGRWSDKLTTNKQSKKRVLCYIKSVGLTVSC